MRLPFLPLLEKIKDTAEQKSMENSTQQARNVDGAFQVSEDRRPVRCCWWMTWWIHAGR